MINPANIVTPLIEIGLERREVTFPDDWYPAAPVRYHCELFGIHALVELGVPTREGTQRVNWCLNPTSSDVQFGNIWKPTAWPGDAWGIATIDRRINFTVDADFPFRARRKIRATLGRFPERSTDELKLPIGWGV